MSAKHRFSTCGGHLFRMKMPRGVIRTKRKGGGTKGLSRCFMVFRYASIVCRESLLRKKSYWNLESHLCGSVSKAVLF